MLEGLEISIKQFGELSNIVDDTLRFDAEHYQRKYEQIDEAITKKNHCVLRELLAMPVITGHTPSMKIERFYGGEISFVKTDNLRENKIVDVFTDYLTAEGNEEIKSSALEADDVIVTIIGATFDVVGRSAIVRESHLPANINQNIALIRLDKAKINPTYFNAYLNTKYGRGSLHHHSRQTEQVNLNCREVERVLVPLFKQLEAGIESLSTKADTAAEQAALIYSKAETKLLATLGMASFSPSAERINIKSFKDSFSATGRLDAEYYQPKYEDYEKAIVNHPAGFTTIAAEFDLVKDTSQREKLAYNYIEISDVSVSVGAASFNRFEVEDLPANAKQEVRFGDLLISKVRPNRGAVAIIDFDDTDLIVSGAFTVLREKETSVFSNETLKVLLRTKMYRDWMLKFNIGTQYPVIRDDDILNLPIPCIDDKTQTKIVALVKESFSLKAESEHLLDVAKRAVEIAIEQDENAGMAYIRANS